MRYKRIKMFLLILSAWVFFHSLYVTIDGLKNNVQKANCILILGNTVNKNGTLSNRLRSRVEKGIELYKIHYAPKIIVSGGLGKEGYYEAREMKKYLIQKGIPEDAIISDENALTTYETMTNFVPISKQYDLHSVIIVSQFFHLTRSKAMLQSQGIDIIYTAHSDYFEIRDGYAILREFVAFYAFQLKRMFS